jgi:hypothetical protein
MVGAKSFKWWDGWDGVPPIAVSAVSAVSAEIRKPKTVSPQICADKRRSEKQSLTVQVAETKQNRGPPIPLDPMI